MSDESEDLAFAIGQVGEGGERSGGVSAGGELGDQAARDPRGDQGVAGGDDLDLDGDPPGCDE